MPKARMKTAEVWEIEKDKRKSEMKVIKGKPQVKATVLPRKNTTTAKVTKAKKVK